MFMTATKPALKLRWIINSDLNKLQPVLEGNEHLADWNHDKFKEFLKQSGHIGRVIIPAYGQGPEIIFGFILYCLHKDFIDIVTYGLDPNLPTEVRQKGMELIIDALIYKLQPGRLTYLRYDIPERQLHIQQEFHEHGFQAIGIEYPDGHDEDGKVRMTRWLPEDQAVALESEDSISGY